MRDISYYQQIHDSVEFHAMPDGGFCAELRTIPGLCAYGETDEFEQLSNQVQIREFVVA